MIVTIPERKARDIARLTAAAASATDALRTYAVTHGGCFAVFGSFARGDVTPTSDFDVLVSFPDASERAALDYAETLCRRIGLVPDVHLASDSSDALLARVRRDGIMLP